MVVSNNLAPNDKASLEYQLFVLLNTEESTVPLMRDFGINSALIDRSLSSIKSTLTVDLKNKINKYIPGLILKNLSLIENQGEIEIICEVENG